MTEKQTDIPELKNKKILLVDDEPQLLSMLEQILYSNGFFQIYTAKSCGEALNIMEKQSVSLCILDVNLPDGDGFFLFREIRKFSQVPVIFLTVRDDTCDIISGFEYGADDYVTKPFELEVLYSRIHALLRRAGNVQSQYLSCGSISIDKNKTAVFCGGEEITVSQAEYHLLQLLMENKGKTVTRERLLAQIWDNNGNYVNDNTLTVTMKRLREKLRQPSCLKTIRSFGYRMEDEI